VLLGKSSRIVLTLAVVVLAGSSEVIYGQIIWNPLEIVQLWDNRAAKFFVGPLYVPKSLYFCSTAD